MWATFPESLLRVGRPGQVDRRSYYCFQKVSKLLRKMTENSNTSARLNRDQNLSQNVSKTPRKLTKNSKTSAKLNVRDSKDTMDVSQIESSKVFI